MAIPGVSVTIVDGGLGVLEPSTNTIVVAGTCTSGTIGTEYTLTNTDGVKTSLGLGPLAQLAARCLQEGGGPIVAIPSSGSVAATASSVSQTGAGPAVFVSGSAIDQYEGRVKIVTGGGLGTGSFKYSLDDGRTYSETYTIPAGQQFLGNLKRDGGLELGFNDDTFVADEEYYFTTTAPMWNASDLAEVMAVVTSSQNSYSLIGLAGEPADTATAATLFAALDTHMTSMASSKRFACAAMDFGSSDTAANAQYNASSISSKRVSACFGRCDMAAALPHPGLGQPQVPGLVPYFSRVQSNLVSTSPARVKSGALTGVAKASLTHDEGVLQTLDSSKLVTLRSHQGRSGAYVTKGWIKAPAGSDFQTIQVRRVFDLACNTMVSEMTDVISEDVRTIAGGKIDPRDAAKFEREVRRTLNTVLLSPVRPSGGSGHVSSYAFAIDRTNNIVSTSTMNVTLTLTPLGYADQIAVTIGFSIPEEV